MRAQRIEVSWIDEQGLLHNEPLAEAAAVPFELARQRRQFSLYPSQLNTPVAHWCSATGKLVNCESFLASCVLLGYEYSGQLVGAASEPLLLHEHQRNGSVKEHYLDFFLRMRDGRAILVDVSRAETVDDPKRASGFELARRAAEQVPGWSHRVETEPEPVFLANLRALAGFRRQPFGFEMVAPALLDACRQPTTFGQLVCAAEPKVLARPAILHLLWQRRLQVDMALPLSEQTVVSVAAGDDDG